VRERVTHIFVRATSDQLSNEAIYQRETDRQTDRQSERETVRDSERQRE
jgi:hypothetical protein